MFKNAIYMMIASFLIQYYAMPVIMTNKTDNITNNVGKLYMSVIMAAMMGLLEVLLPMDMSTKSMNHGASAASQGLFVLGLTTLLGAFVYLYKKQIGVNDANYLSEMIEHHSMAILTSGEIVKKTKNPKVKKLAKQILTKQKEEIKIMRSMSA
jgi:uncharacterized protein (DUF305 family)